MSVLPPHILTAIERFSVAAQEYAFKGSASPDMRAAIVHQYEQAKTNLERAIEKAIK